MSNIVYKKMFEVRFLHDYYLQSTTPGSNELRSYFSLNVDQQRKRLLDILGEFRYDIRSDLSFILSSNESKKYNKQHLKLVTTATGFFIGVEVKEIEVSNNIRFKPVIDLANISEIIIGIKIENPIFNSFTNLSLSKADKLYYFSNQGTHDDASLSQPVEPVVPGGNYRMGDLARIGGGIRQAIKDNNGDRSSWLFTEGTGLVHQGDRQLERKEEWYRDWQSGLSQRSERNLFGVIKISLKGEDNSIYSIDGQGFLSTRFDEIEERIKHPVYEIRFASRKTYWRFTKRNGFSAEEREKMISTAGLVSDVIGRRFVTKIPYSITRDRAPLSRIESEIQLPNAQPGTMKIENGKLISDIEFNDLNPIFADFTR